MNEQDKIQSILKNGGRHLKTYKKENISYDMCLAAVSDDGWAIAYVPEQFKTKQMYSIACKTSGGVLRIVPQEYISEELCIDAVKSDGTALQYVPNDFKLEEICYEAVCENALAFKYVPKDYVNPSFCSRVVKKSGADSMLSVPASCRNADFYLSLVKDVPEVFWIIPKRYRNVEVSKAAVKAMGYSSIEAAVKDQPKIMSYLHTSLYDHDSCLTFVKSNYYITQLKLRKEGGWSAGIVDNELYMAVGDTTYVDLNKLLSFYDVCKEAVRANRLILEAVPEKFKTEELCSISVEADAYSFRFVPDSCKTSALCKLAFNKNPNNIEFIPDKLKTNEMCLNAVRHSGYLLKYVPNSLITREMCELAVMDNARGVKYVPDKIFDKELALLALSRPNPNGIGCLNEIPERLRDYDVCQAAVAREWKDIYYVPDSFKDKLKKEE